MTIDRMLIAYMIVVGLVVGGVLVAVPQAREFRLPPYFWVLLAMVAFDLIAFARGRGAHHGRHGRAAARLCAGDHPQVVVPMLFGAGLPKLF